jgi:hypothetical protein
MVISRHLALAADRGQFIHCGTTSSREQLSAS